VNRFRRTSKHKATRLPFAGATTCEPLQSAGFALGVPLRACVDEWTHRSLIKPDLIPLDVKAKNIQVMGNYALHFDWSDGHNTGIYTYDFLREVCACDDCLAKRTFTV